MSIETKHLLRRGTAAFDAGEYGEAETLLLRVAEQHPTYANVSNMLGVMASLRGASGRAVELFRRALATNPDYVEARLNLAITLADMGAYDSAEVEAEGVQAREPREPGQISPSVLGKLANGHADLARKYHHVGLFAEAVAEYDKAIKLCPDFPDLHNRRAESCRASGDDAAAHASLLRALEINPRYVEAYVHLGQLHYHMGRLDEAIAAWQRALDLMPTHRVARIYLAQATARRVAAG